MYANERALGVASLQNIDKVTIFNDISILEVIKAVKPDTYVRGEEFGNRLDFIKDEIELVENLNGKVVFSSGQVEYSSADFLDNDFFDLTQKK